MTNTYQPADMGMIAALKVGYKCIMLSTLLDLFDVEGGYEACAKRRLKTTKGCRGLAVGGKAHLLDAMTILNDIWNQDGRYAKENGVRRCWRKAGILPIAMETAINVDLGSNSIPMKDKVMSKEDSDDLCNLMSALQVKTQETQVDVARHAIALQGSFAADFDRYSREDVLQMGENWIEIEDEPEVISATIDEEIEELETTTTEAELAVLDDEEPELMDVDPEPADVFASFAEAEEALNKLSESASSLGINQAATVHLDRFARALNMARATRAGKRKRDGTLHSFFTSG
ncbi:expressed unknown protein [Seminavis robusta]|uniref:Uncharacterized protein n=1 Tax=Seminavis robusta TaxID=568900 RepID=A0A9N8DMB7_9STRA|nr:expressed unknown protein [Seminavis robusta]|eukprot:Sro240_g096101.1  (289) ;mRNA; r:27401-28267